MSVEIIILAAGKGQRMQSHLPKVLHCIGGMPMLHRLLLSCAKLKPHRIHVVVGHQKQQVIDATDGWLSSADININLNWVVQAQQKGTGDAVSQAITHVDPQSTVMVLNGDIPLLQTDTLKKVSEVDNSLNLLTVDLDNPFAMGRILRQQGHIIGVIEEKDATEEQRQIKETNTNCMAAPARYFTDWLSRLDSHNAQNEVYLPDIVHCAYQDKIAINSVSAPHYHEALGVNDKLDLHTLERNFQKQRAKQLMRNGVTVIDANRLDIRGECTFGHDCVVDIDVILNNTVKIGNNVTIGPYCVISDSTINDNTIIEAHSVIENSTIGNACKIGPFARIRPHTVLHDQVKVGNFVETKNTELGAETKINHLSYVGDSQIGEHVNIGAGVITCNYDGANKHKTIIEDHVFVGSDCQLVAPVTIKKGATIGAGSTISHDVEPNCLAITRVKQKSITGWQRPKKKSS